MNTKKRKPRNKIKFTDRKTFIHPNISYKMSEKRRQLIDSINHYVRLGLTYNDIAEAIGYSEATIARLYYGYADNCLSSSQLEELKTFDVWITWTEIVSRIAEAGEVPDRTNVLMPVYTSVKIRQLDDNELTDTMPMPFEIQTTKYIPRSPDRDFGKHDNESFEYVDVIDTLHTYRRIKPYVVMYLGACCTI